MPCTFRRRRLVEQGNGGADRDQTGDLVVANDALYQLSYCPIHCAAGKLGGDRMDAFQNAEGWEVKVARGPVQADCRTLRQKMAAVVLEQAH